MKQIHPTAIVSRKAELADRVEIGPFAIIGDGVQLAAGVKVGAHCVVEGGCSIGAESELFTHCSIGSAPQDLKFGGEPSRLEIGQRNRFREFCTVNRGTAGGGMVTRIGDDNYFMAGTHIAHDCQVGSGTIFGNGAVLAGHVLVGDCAGVGAFSGVHQFCRIGRHAYIGGYSVIDQDVAPFVLVVGNRARPHGLNLVGLKRRGFTPATIAGLKRAYRLLFRSGLPREAAQAQVRSACKDCPEALELVEFFGSSQRGVLVR
ncbi:MAG TPA: acyl-ACP--UDP-N-acetylglucosamine O-acyltransferase [Acidobacteriota bacterium]